MRDAILALLVDERWWSTRQIRTRIRGRNTRIAEALALMVGEGLIEMRVIGTQKQFRISEVKNGQ